MTQRLRREWRVLCAAVQFLTRVPVPHDRDFDPTLLNAAVRWFPWVGAAVGGSGAVVLCVAAAHWPPAIAATLVVAWTAWLTAAFHEDGLADTFDALLGAAPRDRALAIMKDARIGTYGALALVLTTLLRIEALAALLAQHRALAVSGLVASHLLGRAAAVLLMALLPYAGDEAHAKAKPLARQVRPRDALCAAAAGLVVLTLPLRPGSAIGALLACGALVAGARWWLRRRIGGFTGDTLGALEQLGEVAVLLALAAA